MALIRTSQRQSQRDKTSLPSTSGRSREAERQSTSPAREKVRRSRRLVGVKHIRKRELIPFTRQAAGMLNAGMSIVATISTLQEQATHPGFRSLLNDLRATIESGSPFSEGIARYPQVFSDIYVNMVRAGERSGQFAEIMKRLAALLDSSARLVRKVKSALTYPIVVLSLALLIAFGLITFVVPVFSEMFESFGSKLPAPTQVLVDTSAFIGDNWAYLLAFFVIGGWIMQAWARSRNGTRIIHRLTLRVPVFGELILKVIIARFARLLGQMLTSGVPILDALQVTANSTGNLVVEESLLKARNMVQEGQTLSDAMEGKPYLPILLVRMSAAGEKSGRLDEMLDNVADAYDDEVETMLATLTSLMEPFLMVFLGIIIGSIVIAMFLPIFQISTVISG